MLQADAYYKYDQAELQALQQQRPWSKDPAYFKKCACRLLVHWATRALVTAENSIELHCDDASLIIWLNELITLSARVRISALALLKMAMHAKSGGNIEVMGMLQARFVYSRPVPVTSQCKFCSSACLQTTRSYSCWTVRHMCFFAYTRPLQVAT